MIDIVLKKILAFVFVTLAIFVAFTIVAQSTKILCIHGNSITWWTRVASLPLVLLFCTLQHLPYLQLF